MSDASSRNLRDWIRAIPVGGCAEDCKAVKRVRRTDGRAWRWC